MEKHKSTQKDGRICLLGWRLTDHRYCVSPYVNAFLVASAVITLLLLIFWRPRLLTLSQCMQEQCAIPNNPEYSYTVVRHTDVDGEDLMHVQARDLQVVKKVCDLFENCAGFNSNGWLKTGVSIHAPGPADLYIKSEIQKTPDSIQQRISNDAFSNEYNDMLNNIKIYIYETNIGLQHRSIRTGGYGVERNMIDELNRSKLRTRKPEEATFFFIPIRCSSYILDSSSEDNGILEARRYIGDMVEHLQRSYSYWERSEGTDHFYVCAHDIGAGVGRDLLKNAIALVNTADYEDPYFVPHKDISLPPSPMYGTNSLVASGRGGAGIDARSRNIFAFFAGDLTSGRIRPVIRKLYISDPDFTIIDREVVWSAYVNYLRQSKFCLVPRGREVWSPRLMEAVFSGCIPVILSDHYHLPLQGIVDWNQFSVIMQESEVFKLKSILLGISASRVAAMQKYMADVYTHFVWNNPAKPNDAFYSVMYQLWQRRNVVRYKPSRDVF